jgi:hypothetical protein
MTALMADRGTARRERRIAATLLRDAWRGTAERIGRTAPRLVLTACATCDLTCERKPTQQALEHLFREALGYGAEGGVVSVTGRRQGGRRSLEMMVERGPGSAGCDNTNPRANLRVILARLLLEMQGASLVCTTSMEAWTARIEFPGRG